MEARGLDVDVWVRAQVADAVSLELDGEVPPEPNYESRMRQEMRLEMYQQLRLLVVDGLVLDLKTIDELAEIIKRIPGI